MSSNTITGSTRTMVTGIADDGEFALADRLRLKAGVLHDRRERAAGLLRKHPMPASIAARPDSPEFELLSFVRERLAMAANPELLAMFATALDTAVQTGAEVGGVIETAAVLALADTKINELPWTVLRVVGEEFDIDMGEILATMRESNGTAGETAAQEV